MSDDKRPEPLRKKRPSSEDISERPTRRESVEPSDQLVLTESTFFSQAPTTRPTGSPRGIPENIGQYQIIRELGRGGMGVVYLARQPGLNREVALKVLNINLHDPEDAARFQSEAKLAASLQHPNIVQIFEIGEQDGYAFMAMEYVAGGNLHQQLQKKAPSPREAAELLEPLARAMQHAHAKGIIHRDLKPGNILLADGGAQWAVGARTERSESKVDDQAPKTEDPGTERLPTTPDLRPTVKITDFGLAKNLNQSMHLTATGVALGTPSYMAPEQAKDDRARIGPLSDVYALGAILYEMLAGKPPFTGRTPLVTMQQVVRSRPVPPREIQAAVPEDLEKICLKCLEKNPKNRFASAQHLAEALQRFLEGPATEVPRPKQQARWPHYLTACSLLIAAGSIIAAYISYRDAKAQKQNALAQRSQAEFERRTATNQIEHAEGLRKRQALELLESALVLGEPGRPDRTVTLLNDARKRVVDGSAPEMDRVLQINFAEWNRQIIRPIATASHPPCVNALSWNPNGKLLASAGEDGHVRFFTIDGKESGTSVESLHGWFGGKRPALSLAWHPYEEVLAVGGPVGHVSLWNTTTRTRIGEPIRPEDSARPIGNVGFGNRGKLLVTTSADGRVRAFDVATRKLIGERLPREEAGAPVALAYSSDSAFPASMMMAVESVRNLFATGGKSGVLRIWETTENEWSEHRSWKLDGAIRSLVFSTDYRSLAVGTSTGALYLWDRIADRLLSLPQEGSAIHAIDFSASGETFATATEGGTVRLWDAGSRQPVGQPVLNDHRVRTVSFHPSADLLAIGDDRGSIRLFEVPATRQAMQPIQLAREENSAITGLVYDRTGMMLLTVSHGFPHLWLVTDKPGHHATFAHLYGTAGSVDPGGGRVAIGGRGGRLHINPFESWFQLPIREVAAPVKSDIRIVTYSPDGSRLLTIARAETKGSSAAGTTSAWLWVVESNTHELKSNPTALFANLANSVVAAAWHPDGKHVALGCDDGKVVIWEIAKNEPTGITFDLGTPALCIAVSPDGKQLAAGGHDGTGKIWNLEQVGATAVPLSHSERIAGITFSPDSKTVLTGSHDKSARFWDAATGWPLGPPLRHPEAVLSVAFHPQSKHAATGCRDAAVRFWKLPRNK